MADNLKTNGKKTADGEYENPVPVAPVEKPKPLPAAPAVTPNPTPLSNTPSDSDYKSLNQQVWGEGGSGLVGHVAQVESEKDRIANDPTLGQKFTLDELYEWFDIAGINNTGSYKDLPRQAKDGDSEADESLMTDATYQLIQYFKSKWYEFDKLAKETTDPVLKQQYLAQRDQMNTNANRARLRMDYSGGVDGSQYLTAGELGVYWSNRGFGPEGPSPGSASGTSSGASSGTSSNAGTSSDLKGLLDAWQQAAMQQSNGKIDYAVAKAVADLERALADAQPQFKEQAESVDRDARQAMDNSALYAEMRGDKGGIGQEQYNSIQNTQAQNHLAVQQAQTKLATDTQRQIADLRAQGEFEKANAALEITQNYLAQLISLEQWAAEYNLSVEQFNESVRQWEASYNMEMQKLQTSQNQWQAEFDYAKQLNSKNQLASMGEALLSAGIPLTDEQLKAMGITGEQASQFLIQQQLAAAQQESSKGGKQELSISDVDLNSAYDYLYSNGLNADSKDDAIVAILSMQGITGNAAKQIAALYKELGYAQAEEKYIESNPLAAPADLKGMNADYFRAEMSSIMSNLGQGNLSAVESRVNYVWSKLSEEQRKELRDALGRYGIDLG